MSAHSLHVLAVLAAGFAAAGVAFVTPDARAQNALGDGRGLDARLNSQRLPNYTRPDFMEEIRLRNAIVTGNAPNGKSFRGSVGYTAPEDFRGVLASDSTYRFRRDSASSAPGIRGADALQFQYAMTTGNSYAGKAFSRLEGAAPEIKSTFDPAAAALGGQVAAGGSALSAAAANASMPPLSAPGLGMLRSAASFASNQSLSPTVVGQKPGAFGYEALVASPLTGIRGATVGESRYRALRTDSTAIAPPGTSAAAPSAAIGAPASTSAQAATPFHTMYDNLRANASGLHVAPTPTDPTNPSDANAPKDPSKPAPGTPTPAFTPITPTTPTTPTTPPAPGTPGTTAPPTPGSPTNPSAGPDATNQPAAAVTVDTTLAAIRDRLMMRGRDVKAGEPATPLAEYEAELLRVLAQPASAYTIGDVPKRDFFAEHMRAAEGLMADARYFDAEERFARALAVTPGEPTAQFGRLHAQIGAGLYTSGALNLRSILTSHPEAIGTKWLGKTIPTPERLNEVCKELEGSFEDPPQRFSPAPEAARLLLAYIAFQRGDRAGVRTNLDGLAALKQPGDGPLLEVLHAVWLPPEEK